MIMMMMLTMITVIHDKSPRPPTGLFLAKKNTSRIEAPNDQTIGSLRHHRVIPKSGEVQLKSRLCHCNFLLLARPSLSCVCSRDYLVFHVSNRAAKVSSREETGANLVNQELLLD